MDGAIVFVFDLDAQKVADVAFNREVQSCCLHVGYDLIELFVGRTCQNRIIRVQNIDALSPVERAFVN